MIAVDSLCTHAICLYEGKVVLQGAPGVVTSRYLQEWLPTFKEVVYDDINTAPGGDFIRLHRARVCPKDGGPEDQITVRTPFEVEFEYWKLAAHSRLDMVAEVFNDHGINVFTTASLREHPAPVGLVRSSFIVPADLMNDGTYRINLMAVVDGVNDVAHWEDVVAFEVHDTASELRAHYHDEWPGTVRPNLEWKTQLLGPLPASANRAR